MPLKSALIKNEETRKDRAFNIATAFKEIFETTKSTSQNEKISTKEFRDVIRANIGAPNLDGEAKNGDLRAHGDAFGKHKDSDGNALDLDTVRVGSERYIVLSKSNYQKCENYLKARNGGSDGLSLQKFM